MVGLDGIADYQFLRSLGRSSSGEYFLARTPPRLPLSAEFVAVKVHSAPTTQDAIRRATRELQAFAAVESKYLVTLFDAGQQRGVFFYAMEYLAGGSLAMPAEPLTRARMLTAVADAAEAAHDLHDAGLVHRDIRPETILLTESGGRLSDLGLARELNSGATMSAMGSADAMEYVDPVLLRGERASAKTDVWSLGVVLHRMVTGAGIWGELPPNDPLLALRRMVGRSPVLAPDIEPRVADVISRCLVHGEDSPPLPAQRLAEELRALV